MKAIAFVACTLLLVSGCFEMKVHEKIIHSELSPDGKWRAVTVMVDGGATTSLSHAVWLTLPNETDYRKGVRVFVADKCYAASAQWTKTKRLKIRSDGTVLILTSLYFGVIIEHDSVIQAGNR